MELIARFALNSFFSSITAFYLCFLIILPLRLLIRNYRALYYLYLLPFIKILADLLFAKHSSWAFLNNQTIFNAIPDSRTLSAYAGPQIGVKLYLLEGYTFSIGDILAEKFGHPFLFTAASILFFLTFFSLLRFSYRLKKATQWQRSLKLEKIEPSIYVAATPLKSPILIGYWKPCIVIPKHLFDILSSKELEAIYTHEQKHLLWKDNILNTFLEGACALFWFIPFQKKLLKKASFYRELSCDKKAHPLHLVTALQKTLSFSPPIGALAFSSVDRAAWILKKKAPKRLATIASLIFLLGGGAFLMICNFLPF